MPPNRKSNVTLLHDLPSINIGQFKVPASVSQQQQQPQENYWDWSAEENDAEISRLQQEEKIRNLFSAVRIEANLVKEAQRMESNSEKATTDTSAESDDYWSMPADIPQGVISQEEVAEEQARAAAKNESYWCWSSKRAQDKENYIQRSLQVKEAHRLTSTAFVEQKLAEEAKKETVAGQQNPAHDSYWDF